MGMNLPYADMALTGKFKGKSLEDHHILNVANETKLGSNARWWIEKLVEVCESEGRTKGLIFSTPDGDLSSCLSWLWFLKRSIFTRFRMITTFSQRMMILSLCMSLVSRAKRTGHDDKLEEMNHWRSVEYAKGRCVRRKISVLYPEALLLMCTTCYVSYAWQALKGAHWSYVEMGGCTNASTH